MTPLLFGESGDALFGVLEGPTTGQSLDHGVVLCPPIAGEHVRTYRLMRHVASTLSRAGFHTLRFDWFGGGDSAGAFADATIARWSDDLRMAVTELRDATGVRKVSVFGIRMGATIALRAAARLKLDTIAAWDPVLTGSSYLRAQRALHAELVCDPNRFWRLSRPSQRTGELVGFVYGHRLVAELDQLTLESLIETGDARTVLMHSEGVSTADLFNRLTGRGARATSVELAAKGNWDQAHAVEQRLSVAPLGPAIVRALTQGPS